MYLSYTISLRLSCLELLRPLGGVYLSLSSSLGSFPPLFLQNFLVTFFLSSSGTPVVQMLVGLVVSLGLIGSVPISSLFFFLYLPG